MFDLLRKYQLNIMLVLCGACAILALLVAHTRFLPKKRRRILLLMELIAFFLLWFDRLAYVYSGDISIMGGIMVRLSNFFVFFLTSGMVFGMSIYLMDMLKNDGNLKEIPKRLKISEALSVCGMLLAVLAAFTGMYYYFDSYNTYHRGSGFYIAYIIPVIGPLMQLTVIIQYRRLFSRLIYTSLSLFIVVPIVCGIIQVFTYGVSLVNMSMVAVSVGLYIFTYMDINDTVEHAHEIEVKNIEDEKQRMQRLFDQTATAFVSAVEKKDDFLKGTAVRTADCARKIAEIAGKDEAECEKVYYTALLHNVGLIGIPDSVIKNENDPQKWERELMKQTPLIGMDILSSITEYPYLAIGAMYSHERYNGTGYPKGLKGEEIPEIARIVAVADAYVTMTTKKRFRDARPDFIAREAFVKGAGEEFDPVYANCMIKLIDQSGITEMPIDLSEVETQLICGEYRDNISASIPIDSNVTSITFECHSLKEDGDGFSAPSVILFDSYDKRIHDNEKSIAAYKYLEYAEVFFDKNSITTAARKVEMTKFRKRKNTGSEGENVRYEIVMGRYDDHIRLNMTSPLYEKEVIAALPDGAKSAYLALTGEYCKLTDIVVINNGNTVKPDDIPKIVSETLYTDRMESDIKNIQISRTRSDTTRGLEIKKHLTLMFHSMSLPGADLIWHCPYIVIFSSDNGYVGGKDYREYALIKLYGENEVKDEYAQNSITMKKNINFISWDVWKESNRRGIECEVHIERKGSSIITTTENLGIEIENTTTIKDMPEKIYAAITGDQVALTDIRFRRTEA